jgi:selenide,water dikinase
MPLDRLSRQTIGRILAGGAAGCEAAGVTIAGGHSIDAAEPTYGLTVIGLIDPGSVVRNDAAQAGDVMILGKPLGIGILATALKRGELDDEGYAEMLRITTRLNTIGIDLARIPGVHAMTDVTGFGLLGHLLEICRGSELAASLDCGRLPISPAARKLAKRGFSTGAGERNWASYAEEVILARELADWERNILCDPQTSGGLLVCCGAGDAEDVMRAFNDQGFAEAAAIGAFAAGPAAVTVR